MALLKLMGIKKLNSADTIQEAKEKMEAMQRVGAEIDWNEWRRQKSKLVEAYKNEKFIGNRNPEYNG